LEISLKDKDSLDVLRQLSPNLRRKSNLRSKKRKLIKPCQHPKNL
jgi:hypothetical protein